MAYFIHEQCHRSRTWDEPRKAEDNITQARPAILHLDPQEQLYSLAAPVLLVEPRLFFLLASMSVWFKIRSL